MACTKLRNIMALQTTQRILLISNIMCGEDKSSCLNSSSFSSLAAHTVQTRANATDGDSTYSSAMKMAGQ